MFTTTVGTPIDPRNLTRFVQRACRDASVREVRLHDFRHGCITALLGIGVPPRAVIEIVGHSTLDVMMNIYDHVSLDDSRAVIDRLGSLLRARRGRRMRSEMQSESTLGSTIQPELESTQLRISAEVEQEPSAAM